MRRFHFWFGLLSVLCFLATFSLPAWSAQEIKIGVVTPTKFSIGALHWNPTVLAAEEINKAGGVTIGDKKYKIKLFKENSNELMSVVDAVNAVERLITVRDVDFIMGTIRSEAAIAQLEVTADHKKIFMTIGAASPNIPAKVTKNYDRYKYWFRGASVNSMYQGKYTFGWVEQVGRAIREQLGIEKPKVAILAEKALWAEPVVKILKAKLPKLGFEIGPVFRP
ncbi:MAG: ABC transporter substrate-binding protein, partial [Pirellulales bacterium]|nr:ABC transporter substrate-binding protein [Pirellulales bacterium]